MAITRFQTYLNEAEEQEEKKKKTQSFQEWSAQQKEKTPEVGKSETTGKVQSFRQWASDNGQAPAPQATTTTTAETKTPQISNTYREVDKENGRIRTRSADLSTPSWQDDPEEMAAELNMLGAT